MSGVNKVILIGNVGKDPETRVFEGGMKKVSFTLATSENYKDKQGNRKEYTEWHNIACWRSLADIAEKYFTKGKLLYVEGRLRTRNWEENGVKKYFTEIIADAVTMLGSRGDGKSTEQKVENAEPVSFSNPELTPGDDLPF